MINAKVPLYFAAAVNLVFGLSMLLSPLAFLNQYSIKVSDMSQTDSSLAGGILQQWGIWLMMTSGWFSIANRVGSERTRMHLNFAGFVGGIVNLSLTLYGFDAITRIGCSLGGLWFNIILFSVMTILFGLGCSLNIELAPIKKPIYWASSVIALVVFAYFLAFLLFSETLFNGYHVSFDDVRVRVLIITCVRYGLSGLFFQMSALLVAGMMTTDFMYIYVLNRFIAMIEVGMCFVMATNAAWWNTKNEHGNLDSFIIGQYTSFGMFLTFFLLAYVPICMVDTQIAKNVNEAIGGAAAGAPTLLAQGSQQKSGYKESLLP